MFNPRQRSQGIDTRSGAGRKTPTVPTSSTSIASSFRRDERGSVAIIFALTSFIVIALIGGAVDYGRAVTAREQIQNAVDASVLAAARVWQTESDIALAEAKGMEFYEKNKPQNVTSGVSSFTTDFARNAIVMEATADVPAPFLTAAAGTYMRQNVEFRNFTVYARSEALLAVGGNSEQHLEISLMLDVTGSMAGSKISDMKAAAKDLIDIVVWSDQSEYTSRVAIVPFANGINLGSTALVNQVRGAVKTGSCTSAASPCTAYTTSSTPSATQWTTGAPAAYYRFTPTSGNTPTLRPSSYCVTERTGNDRYTDEAPNTPARKVGPLYFNTTNNQQSSNASLRTPSSEVVRCGGDGSGTDLLNEGDLEQNAVMPLSSDKTELKQRIDKLSIAGATAGQLGTAWAWYMLSPKWAYLWPSASQPKPYFTDKTQKIAILMTDGEYNTAHCNGVLSANSSANSAVRINCNANNANSDSQADALCTAMKTNTGITVYTIGFALGGNNTAITTLRNCASDTSKFYDAEDGDELRQAFRDIALQISKLRLSQ